jgi:hypothetical protein
MKKVNIIRKTFTAVIIVSVIAAACSKSSSTDTSNTDNQTAAALTASDAISDNLYDDAFNEVMSVNDENGLSAGRIAYTGSRVDSLSGTHGCATVTVTPKDQSTYPKTVVIDYGTTGCTGANGVTRKGKTTYSLSGKLTASGTVISVSFTDYSANGYKVEGTYSITNNGGTNSLNITTKVVGGKITYPDGSWYAYSSTKTLLQTAGMSTSTPADDVFSITGSNTCSSSAGKSITATIKTALVKNTTCKNIVSGTIDIVYNNIKGVFDYGSGACDNLATLTIGNSVQNITLP